MMGFELWACYLDSAMIVIIIKLFKLYPVLVFFGKLRIYVSDTYHIRYTYSYPCCEVDDNVVTSVQTSDRDTNDFPINIGLWL
jgi:hypothetical protein